MYEENAVLHALCTRRSVRSYNSTKPVEQEKIQAVLTAGQYAPHRHEPYAYQICGDTKSGNAAPAVQSKRRDHGCSRSGSVLWSTGGNSGTGRFHSTHMVEDGSLAMGAMLNAAYAVGLGSCWIHRARETFDSEAGKALLKQWGIPETYRGVGFCILGYAAGELPQPKPRKDDQILWID